MTPATGRKFSLWGALVSALVSTAAVAHPQGPLTGTVTIAKVAIGTDHAQLLRLKNEGYDIAGVNLTKGTADVIIRSSQERLALGFQGFQILSSHDVDTERAPDANYKTPDEIRAILRQYAADYPALAHVESIGQTLEGRDIWALKISTNPDSHDPSKPTVLFNGMHHAREVMSSEVVLDTADQLLTKYGHDASVTKWVDGAEIWLVPMVNPDGNNKVWTGNSMWRKNTRGGYGVDINRNYPYAWNVCDGSSSSTWADDYHGPSAGSELETQAMVSFISRIQPVFDISYHSYSELVIYPYGCGSQRSETKEIVEPLGQQMAGLVQSEDSGHYSPGTSWELLYDVDGGDLDWMYHEQHVIPYVIEMNSDSSGFQPPWSKRQPTVEALRPAWQLLLDRLGQSGIRGHITDGAGRVDPNTLITVKAMGEAPLALPISWKVKNDGSYHIVLNPGMYTLSFALGDKTVEKQVTVGADRVDMDVQL